MTRVSVVEWPDGLLPGSQRWKKIVDEVAREKPDLLITNEMPFGYWAPTYPAFDKEAAARWADLHAQALEALAALDVPGILSSRPVMGDGFLVNEAFLLEKGAYRRLHHKHFFPSEPGWEEASWFRPIQAGFTPQPIGTAVVGALICTELMFPEFARLLGKRGAQLIAAPRATGANHWLWQSAGLMAAVSAGAFVASSNRSRGEASVVSFGGGGFILDPEGKVLVSTQPGRTIATTVIDEAAAMAAKQAYPAYVSDLHVEGREL